MPRPLPHSTQISQCGNWRFAHALSSIEACKFESDTLPELNALLLAAIDVWNARSLELEAAATGASELIYEQGRATGTYSLNGAPFVTDRRIGAT